MFPIAAYATKPAQIVGILRARGRINRLCADRELSWAPPPTSFSCSSTYEYKSFMLGMPSFDCQVSEVRC
jgi:hypothetical protein